MTDDATCSSRISQGDQSETERKEVPEAGQEVDVVADHYECVHCGAAVEVADFAHRTRLGYDAPTIRCQCKDVPMVRVAGGRRD